MAFWEGINLYGGVRAAVTKNIGREYFATLRDGGKKEELGLVDGLMAVDDALVRTG